MGIPESLAPLRDRRFAWFFVGRSVSTAGSVMAPVALTFAVLDIEHDASALGKVLAARSITLVLFLLVGGVVADRFSRSTVLQISHICSALTQGVVAYLVVTQRAQLSQLMVLEIANGAWTAFTMPAIQGVVPQVVPRAYLQQANALMSFSRSGLTVLGPTIAAMLVVTVGPGWALAVDALSWAVAAACMVPVRLPSPKEANGGRHSLWAELSSGWSVFTRQVWLWVVVIAFGVLNAIHAGAWLTLGPVVASNNPDIGRQGWGYALSAQAIGLLTLTVVMLRWSFRYPLRAGLLSMLLLALPLVILGSGGGLLALVVASFVAGAGVEVFGIAWQTTIHQRIPSDHMSRIAAYDSLGSFIAIPAGQMAYGPLAAQFGIHEVMVGSTVLFVLVVVLAVGVPQVRQLRSTSLVEAEHQVYS